MASRWALTSPNILTGSASQAAQSSGSTDSSRSRESGCHDQRKLVTIAPSLTNSGGNAARTVSRLNAFTGSTLAGQPGYARHLRADCTTHRLGTVAPWWDVSD